MQEEQTGVQERVVANSKPMVSFVSKAANQFPIALGSSASHSPEALKSTLFEFRPYRYGETPCERFENTASSSQVWHSDANTITSTERPVAATTKNPIRSKLSHHNFVIFDLGFFCQRLWRWHCTSWTRLTRESVYNKQYGLPKGRTVVRCFAAVEVKVRVYSDSVLCLGKTHDHPQSIAAWKQKIGSRNVLNIANRMGN